MLINSLAMGKVDVISSHMSIFDKIPNSVLCLMLEYCNVGAVQFFFQICMLCEPLVPCVSAIQLGM